MKIINYKKKNYKRKSLQIKKESQFLILENKEFKIKNTKIEKIQKQKKYKNTKINNNENKITNIINFNKIGRAHV